MMKLLTSIIFLIGGAGFLIAQHTFSIVAIDTITKEVGGAGATCLSLDREGYEALIISDIIPGKGAIHTQSYWHPENQQNARTQLLNGLDAKQLINWLENNDVANDPSIRQYGVSLFDSNGEPSSEGFTGSNCLDEKIHKVGRNYSIQGNILIGKYVIDSMEKRFLNAQGSLADKLMASMKGALIPGADSRCLSEGLSSRSSFIRVAKPNNSDDSLYLDINVGSTRDGLDPIDSLETRYKQWKKISTLDVVIDDFKLKYNAKNKTLVINTDQVKKIKSINLNTSTNGITILKNIPVNKEYNLNKNLPSGIYILSIEYTDGRISSKKLLIQ
ncbi:MAG TPA: DUF1028 domain-containing protein [Saprospiraceae bacterium]|nr:DUF1028 domain-containing protein [Saprospiraceae bacterium]